ncbi:hypothetical protein O6H91_20G014700 [Diphasiastrum complanatum]|uniref:Uncharacterized protein n=1 Tax=Diphasiastrum complanatum TaxID=34168 RepID=A0ACC2AN36_DIPCM|nr:hypothetical protein O6H91_20G014700 [Diphasiastrum complanatum]
MEAEHCRPAVDKLYNLHPSVCISGEQSQALFPELRILEDDHELSKGKENRHFFQGRFDSLCKPSAVDSECGKIHSAKAVPDMPSLKFSVAVQVSGMNNIVPHEQTGGSRVKGRRASRWDCGPKEANQNSSSELRNRAPDTHLEATTVTQEISRILESRAPNGQINSLQYTDLGKYENSKNSSRTEIAARGQQSEYMDGDAFTGSASLCLEVSKSCGGNEGFKDRAPSQRDHTTNRGIYGRRSSRCNVVGAPVHIGRNSDSSRHNLSRRYRGRDHLTSSKYSSERKISRNSSETFVQRKGNGRYDEWFSRGGIEYRSYRSDNHSKKDWRQGGSFGSQLSAVNRADERREKKTVQNNAATGDSVSRTFTSQLPCKVSFTTLENTQLMHNVSEATAGEEYSDKQSQKAGWVYLDNDGLLQGPMELAALKVLHESGRLKSDHMVKKHMSNEWVTLEHAESPKDQKQLRGRLDSTLRKELQVDILERCLSTNGAHGDVSVDEHLRGVATHFADCEKNTVYACTGKCNRDYLHSDSGSTHNLLDFHIDERVDRLMQGFTLIPGKEKEIVSEALSAARQMKLDDRVLFQNDDLSPQSHGGFSPFGNPWKEGDFCGDALSFEGLGFDVNALCEPSTKTFVAVEVQEVSIPVLVTCSDATPLEHRIDFRQLTLRGGDWKLVYPFETLPQGQMDTNVGFEKSIGRKVVLKNGQPLCDFEKSGLPDPRKRFQESSNAVDSCAQLKIDLPPWVHAIIEEKLQSTDRLEHSFEHKGEAYSVKQRDLTFKSHCSSFSHHASSKSEMSPHTGNLGSKSASRAFNNLLGSGTTTSVGLGHLNQKSLKGPVVKAGTIHVAPGNEQLSSLNKDIAEVRKCSSTAVLRTCSTGALSCKSGSTREQIIEHHNGGPEKVDTGLVENCDLRSGSGNPISHVQVDGKVMVFENTIGEVDFQHGDWFYLDGTGNEVGPFSFAQLQAKVEDGMLPEGMSVYQRSDAIWIPLFAPNMAVQRLEAPRLPVVDHEVHDNISSPGPPGVGREPLPYQSQSLFSSAVTPSSDLPRSLQGSQTILHGRTHVNSSHPSMAQFHLISDVEDGINCSSSQGHSSVLNLPNWPWDVQKVHPSFMGFARGRLHEFVLRHYRSHLLPATLHECLEAWLQGKRMCETINMLPSPNAVNVSASLLTEPHSRKLLESDMPDLFPALPDKALRNIQHHKSTSGSPSGVNSKYAEENTSKVPPTNVMVGDSKRRLEPVVESEDEKSRQRRPVKRRRLLHLQDLGGDSGHEPSMSHPTDHPMLFNEKVADSKSMVQVEPCWGNLPEKLLRRIYHCFLGDLKSLACAGATCKVWRKAAQAFRKEISNVDLSLSGVSCTDAVLHSLAKFGGNFTRISLRGCTMVSSTALKCLLHACPSIIAVDITGCDQFQKLMKSFAQIEWFSSSSESKSSSVGTISSLDRDDHYKMKSLKSIGEKRDFISKISDVEITEFPFKRAKLEATEDARTPGPVDVDVTCLTDQGSQSFSNDDICKEVKTFDRDSIVKLGLESANPKAAQSKNGSKGYPFHNKGKLQSRSSNTMHKVEGKRRMKGAQPSRAEKCAYPKWKGELLGRNGAASPVQGDKLLEKEFASILKAVVDADSNKFFFHTGVSDGKGSTMNGRYMDFLTIEKKLNGGHYCMDKEGFKSFKEDLFLLCRSAFHLNVKSSYRLNARSSPLATAASEIFKTAHRMVKALENSLCDASPHESQAEGKMSNIIPSAKSRRKSQGGYSSFNSGVKGHRRDVGGVKGKTGASKKKSMSSSIYLDMESDWEFREEEGRRFTKNSSKNWSDSDTEISDEDVPEDDSEEDSEGFHGSDSEGDDLREEESDDIYDSRSLEMGIREWGARMTKAAMVPPITRKYEVIEDYTIVIDQPEVDRKMRLEMPEDYLEKLQAARETKGGEYSHLDIPELKEYRPRKRLGEEVVEQEVYGIEPYTYNLLMDTMPKNTLEFSEKQKHQYIEEGLLRTLNEEASHYTGTRKAPMEYPLISVVQKMSLDAQRANNRSLHVFCQGLLSNMQKRPKDKYVAYRKGLGVVCNTQGGFQKDDFVVEFLGEVYPAWRWYEKQDAIRSLQKKERDSATEFYNIMLERPKGDAGGYDLVVVDAMHKANYASRICHSCQPNCEAKVTAVNGRYTIGVYTLRPVLYGEELTFDYNSVTESKEEWKISICLCGSHVCRGSYLNLTGAGTFEEVMKRCHGLLDRHHMLLEACGDGEVTQHEWNEMKQAGVGTCMLSGLPNWAIKYTARLVGFINLERTLLPEEMMKANQKKKRELGSHAYYELERLDAEIQADGVYNNRLQNLAITLDKVRYVLTKLYNEPCKAPPPLRRLESKELVNLLWTGEGSVVGDLLHSIAPHVSREDFLAFERKVRIHDPDESKNVESNLRHSLFWLRDKLRSLSSSCVCRHDAAADIIHLYACTKYFFTSQEYNSYDSPAISLNSLDLGPRHSYGLGTGVQYWSKTYGKDYVLGQLIYWYKQDAADPGSSLAKARRGCLVLPDVSSCYSKTVQQDFRRGYGSRKLVEMIAYMEQRPQKQWPKAEFWKFKSNGGLFGSPMLDSVRTSSRLNPDMLRWLRTRPAVFEGPWDEL